jgi:hypothetical protein
MPDGMTPTTCIDGAIKRDALIDDVFGTTEMTLPKRMTENDNCPLPVHILQEKGTAQYRSDANN